MSIRERKGWYPGIYSKARERPPLGEGGLLSKGNRQFLSNSQEKCGSFLIQRKGYHYLENGARKKGSCPPGGREEAL